MGYGSYGDQGTVEGGQDATFSSASPSFTCSGRHLGSQNMSKPLIHWCPPCWPTCLMCNPLQKLGRCDDKTKPPFHCEGDSQHPQISPIWRNTISRKLDPQAESRYGSEFRTEGNLSYRRGYFISTYPLLKDCFCAGQSNHMSYGREWNKAWNRGWSFFCGFWPCRVFPKQ